MSPVPLADLAQQLGHADNRMTTRHHAHLPDHWRADHERRSDPSLGEPEVPPAVLGAIRG